MQTTISALPRPSAAWPTSANDDSTSPHPSRMTKAKWLTTSPRSLETALAVAGARTSSTPSSPVANRIIAPSALIRRVIYEMRFNASAEAMLTIGADPNHLVPASPSRRYAVAVSPISNAYGFILGASIHPRGTLNVSASCGKQERGCGIGSFGLHPRCYSPWLDAPYRRPEHRRIGRCSIMRWNPEIGEDATVTLHCRKCFRERELVVTFSSTAFA